MPSNLSLNDLRHLAQAWDAAGLPASAASPRPVIARHLEIVDRLGTERRAAVAAIEAERAALPAAVATGAVTIQAAAERRAALDSALASATGESTLYRATVAHVLGQCSTDLAERWDKTTAACIAAFDAAVADLAATADALAGVTSADEASAAGPEVAAAWSTACATLDRMNSIRRAHGLARRLADQPSPSDEGYPDALTYRRPELRPARPPRRGGQTRHAVVRMLDDIATGAEPAIVTADELADTVARLRQPTRSAA